MMKYAPDPEPMSEQKEIKAEKPKYNKSEAVGQQQEQTVVAISSESVSGIDLGKVNIAQIQKGVLYRGHELSEALSTILMACVHISNQRFYGVYVLNEVVHGSQAEKVMKARLNQIPEYGKLSRIPINETTLMINWLIDNHYLHQTKGQYPVLHPTSDTELFAEKITIAQLNKLMTSLERSR